MAYRVLADVVLAVHAGFVLFVVLGGLVALRWPRVVWLHAPAAAWGVLVELGGWVCPLTPLESWLRWRASHQGFADDFIHHYLVAVLYPNALTRAMQVGLGAGVLLANLLVYGWVLHRRGRARSRERIP